MLKIKIFSGYVRDVEKEVNEFLSRTQDDKIIDFKVQETPGYITVVVMYES